MQHMKFARALWLVVQPVWRAKIVLLSADGVGTNEIKRRTGNSKLHDVVGLYVNPTESLPGLKCQI